VNRRDQSRDEKKLNREINALYINRMRILIGMLRICMFFVQYIRAGVGKKGLELFYLSTHVSVTDCWVVIPAGYMIYIAKC
jgi:hypothetical protein